MKKPESLEKVVEHLEEEARMVLPGIQALFGFQLIAVFNQRFPQLSHFDQVAHFGAILLTAVSVLFVLTPAAYHRQAEPDGISDIFANIGTFCLTVSMLPLAMAISLDIYVIGRLVFPEGSTPEVSGAVTFVGLFLAWFIFPRVKKPTRG